MKNISETNVFSIRIVRKKRVVHRVHYAKFSRAFESDVPFVRSIKCQVGRMILYLLVMLVLCCHNMLWQNNLLISYGNLNIDCPSEPIRSIHY